MQALTLENVVPIRLTRPDDAALERAIAAQQALPFSYEQVGGTRGPLPVGWSHDDAWVVLGSGAATWERACDALRRWVQFDLGWVRLLDTSVPLAEGEVVAFASQQLGVWAVNVCRIAYVLDEMQGDTRRYGFAYGTLAAHSVRGEERFMLEWDQHSDEVRFGITKFSRPQHPLIHLLEPLARRVQRRFTLDALARMQAEVQS